MTKLNVRACMLPVLTFAGVEEQPASVRAQATKIRSELSFMILVVSSVWEEFDKSGLCGQPRAGLAQFGRGEVLHRERPESFRCKKQSQAFPLFLAYDRELFDE